MNKEQKLIIKKIIKAFEEMKKRFYAEHFIDEIEIELEKLTNLKDGLQEQLDEMSEETKQDSDEGQKIVKIIDMIYDLEGEIDTLKNLFGDSPFEDIIDSIKNLME
jgi:predicted  nucleic acid-binding Zn-ribbon protein